MAYNFDFANASTDSPWNDDPSSVSQTEEAEWSKLSSDFTNAGYREGITAGKESALQEGFDAGFAQIGVPLGRELSVLRGLASALLSFLSMLPPSESTEVQIVEARAISAQLSEVRFSDIAPCDLEAEQHAREHLEAYGEEMDENEEVEARRKVEQLEDMMNQLTAGADSRVGEQGRMGVEDVKKLRTRLEVLSAAVGVDVTPFWS